MLLSKQSSKVGASAIALSSFEGTQYNRILWKLRSRFMTSITLIGAKQRGMRGRCTGGTSTKHDEAVTKHSSARRSQKWGRSSAGRAPALQAGGQEFDSPRLHHNMGL